MPWPSGAALRALSPPPLQPLTAKPSASNTPVKALVNIEGVMVLPSYE